MDRPTASPPYFPFREHRTLAEVPALAERGEMRVMKGWPVPVAYYRPEPRTYATIPNFRSWGESIARTCPKCGAAPNHLCKTSGGHAYGGGIHTARRVG
jgi:hypothetical protein